MHVRRAFASATVLATAMLAWSSATFAQGGAPQAPPAGQGRGGGGVAFGPPTDETPYDDYTGFTKIFDGKTFTNWNWARRTCGPSSGRHCSTPTRPRRRGSITSTTSGRVR